MRRRVPGGIFLVYIRSFRVVDSFPLTPPPLSHRHFVISLFRHFVVVGPLGRCPHSTVASSRRTS